MGLIIDYSFDSSVTSLQTSNPTLYGEYTSAVTAAVNFFDSEITSPITVNINFGWGEVAGSPISPGASGESSTSQDGGFTYANVLTALQGKDTTSAVQIAAVQSLPAPDPTGGASFNISTAQEKALGLIPANGTANDGSVGLDSSSNTNFTWIGQPYAVDGEDAVGTIEHEISEVLGRSDTGGKGGQYTPLDLFRYTAADGLSTDAIGGMAGVRDQPFVAGYSANAPSYFSYNGQNVTLLYETPADVANGTDVADWSPSVGQDSFGDSPVGAPTPVSSTDLQELNVLGYTLVTCFAEGTRLDIANGSTEVEALRVGDWVLTASGQSRPVRWIGRRHLEIRRHTDPRKLHPIRIRAGALADNLPRRDLRVSPDHAMLLDGLLIPARLLMNGASILREDHCVSVTYYHVELDAHDILLAEGAPAESYLDTGNRATFENAGEPMLLHPAMGIGQARREAESCAPFAADTERVKKVWQRLAHRAARLGLTLPEPIETTPDPALCIEVGGKVFNPVAIQGQRHTFVLPAWRGAMRLRSRHATPCDGQPWLEDQRRLGVMVRRMTLCDMTDVRTIPVDHPMLCAGWWDTERNADLLWRWTDGDAVVAISSDTQCKFVIEADPAMGYPLEAPTGADRLVKSSLLVA